MNDREFIELLNLYIDHEITREDAVRLEAEVVARPDRREIYNEYCRMQKACSMLSEQFADAPVRAAPEASGSRWGLGAALAGLAAACLIVVVGLRMGANRPAGASALAASPAVAAAQPTSRPVDDMQPVFVARAPVGRSASASSVFVSYDPLRQAPQFNWIGAVQFSPVATAPSLDVGLGPRAGLKATILSDTQGSRDTQQPGEMAAFRFQR
jgi:hypothetical protein